MAKQELTSEGLLRLQDEHIQLYHDARGRLRKWEEFLQDYTALEGRLLSLPDQITHNVMIPFGHKAFMPGELIHTNEVMVLLGDNWFVQRSTKQSVDIIHRRKHYLSRMLNDTKKELANIEAHLGMTGSLKDATNELQDCIEIHEEVPARTTAPSTAHAPGKRVAHVPKVVGGQKAMPPRPAFPKTSSDRSGIEQKDQSKGRKSFEELMAHLEELKLEEDANSSEEEETGTTSDTATIHFKHTDAHATIGEASDQSGAILSPADIYACYHQQQEDYTTAAGVNSTVDDDDIDSALSSYYGSCEPVADMSGGASESDAGRVDLAKGVGAHSPKKLQKSSLKRPGERSSSGRVRFSEEVDERQLEAYAEERSLPVKSQSDSHSKSKPADDVTAFTGHVVERLEPKEVPAEADKTTRPVSRFKASRRKT